MEQRTARTIKTYMREKKTERLESERWKQKEAERVHVLKAIQLKKLAQVRPSSLCFQIPFFLL